MNNELENIVPLSDAVSIEQETTSRAITTQEKEKLTANLSNARSLNTRLAYESAWKKYVLWCDTEGMNALPSEPWVVALYLDYLNDQGRKVSTLNTAVSAIQAMHQDNGFSASFFTHHLVKSTLSAAKRAMADDGRSAVSKPTALSEQMMKDIVSLTNDSPSGIRDHALLALGFNAGLRASEIAALIPSDVVFDEHGMTVTIRKSKTDQHGSGESFYIQALAPMHHSLCAVHQMKRWLNIREQVEEIVLTSHTPIFFALRKGSRMLPYTNKQGVIRPLTRQTISNIVAGYAEKITDTGNYSAHSLRHSFITLAFSKNIPSQNIAKVSRHRNMRVLAGYDQTSAKQASFNLSLWG